jgi:hypothetical protein
MKSSFSSFSSAVKRVYHRYALAIKIAIRIDALLLVKLRSLVADIMAYAKKLQITRGANKRSTETYSCPRKTEKRPKIRASEHTTLPNVLSEREVVNDFVQAFRDRRQ